MTVDGVIELERLTGVLFVGKPAGAREGAETSLFRVSADGREAARVPVRLGRSSATAYEVVSGLHEGDRILVSDTSAWDRHDRIRLQ
jgi:HlyD family secretion protein